MKRQREQSSFPTGSYTVDDIEEGKRSDPLVFQNHDLTLLQNDEEPSAPERVCGEGYRAGQASGHFLQHDTWWPGGDRLAAGE